MEQILRKAKYHSKIWPSALSVLLFGLSTTFFADSILAQVTSFAFPGRKPAEIPKAWKPLIGEYGPEQGSFMVLEKSGKLALRENDGTEINLQRAPGGTM